MRLAIARWSGATVVLFLLVAFLLIFPKGGLKVADIPVTFGYVLLGVVAWAAWVHNLAAGRAHRLTGRRALVIFCLVPFQLVVLASVAANGVESVGFLISVIASLAFLPFALIGLLGPQVDRLNLETLFKLLRFGVLVVALYGIFLFFYKLLSGHFLEIPYLTVNADDVGSLEDTKHIDRGGIFKLISTYNNGNIYGVCILMLLPLYELVQKSLSKRLVVKLSLVMTLSRTVWIGLLLYEIFSRAFLRRLSVRTVIGLLAALLLGAGGVSLALSLLATDTSWIFDPDLGGRADLFSAPITMFPEVRFDGITEIVYLSVAAEFGVIGLGAFLVAMLPPVILHLMRKVPLARSRYKRTLALSLWLYLMLALSDGALLYIPVMAFYWFIVALLLSTNSPKRKEIPPAYHPASAVPDAEPGSPSPAHATELGEDALTARATSS